MKSSKIFDIVTVALLSVVPCTVAVAQDHATPQEVVTEIREAAINLSKSGDVAQFSQKQSPWVWKDSYIYVADCDKKIQVAHPIKPELVGVKLTSIKDAKSGKSLFPEGWCETVENSPSGIWDEYWWPKPGEKEPSRKIAYHLKVKGTPYVLSAGIYDDKATIEEVSKLSTMK